MPSAAAHASEAAASAAKSRSEFDWTTSLGIFFNTSALLVLHFVGSALRESDVTRNAVDALFVVVAVINVALAEHRRKMSTELTRTTAVSLNKISWAKSAALQEATVMRFAASAAHELRNPMHAITAFVRDSIDAIEEHCGPQGLNGSSSGIFKDAGGRSVQGGSTPQSVGGGAAQVWDLSAKHSHSSMQLMITRQSSAAKRNATQQHMFKPGSDSKLTRDTFSTHDPASDSPENQFQLLQQQHKISNGNQSGPDAGNGSTGQVHPEQLASALLLHSIHTDLVAAWRRCDDTHRIINDMIDLGKLKNNELELKPEVFELVPWLERLVGSHRSFMHAGVALKVMVMTEVPPLLHMDKLRLAQVLANGITNSAKNTNHGFVAVSTMIVDTTVFPDLHLPHNPSNKWLAFTSCDTGKGLQGKDVEALFTLAGAAVQRKSASADAAGGKRQQLSKKSRGRAKAVAPATSSGYNGSSNGHNSGAHGSSSSSGTGSAAEAAAQGSGIGLPTARMMARLLGGDLTLYAESHTPTPTSTRVTRFLLIFPLDHVAAAPPQLASPAAAADTTTAAAAASGGRPVLDGHHHSLSGSVESSASATDVTGSSSPASSAQKLKPVPLFGHDGALSLDAIEHLKVAVRISMARAYGVRVGLDGTNTPLALEPVADPVASNAVSELPACITGKVDIPSRSPASRPRSPAMSDGGDTAATSLYISPTGSDIDDQTYSTRHDREGNLLKLHEHLGLYEAPGYTTTTVSAVAASSPRQGRAYTGNSSMSMLYLPPAGVAPPPPASALSPDPPGTATSVVALAGGGGTSPVLPPPAALARRISNASASSDGGIRSNGRRSVSFVVASGRAQVQQQQQQQQQVPVCVDLSVCSAPVVDSSAGRSGPDATAASIEPPPGTVIISRTALLSRSASSPGLGSITRRDILETSSGSAPRILWVDDDPVNGSLGVRMLSRIGCEVETAENGLAAIQILHRTRMVTAATLAAAAKSAAFASTSQRHIGTIELLSDPELQPPESVAITILDNDGASVAATNPATNIPASAASLPSQHSIQRFDAIIMDVDMPILDGVKTSTMIKLDPSWSRSPTSLVPIIACTGHSSGAGDDAGLVDGAKSSYDAVLAKPFNSQSLESLLLACVPGLSKSKQ